MIIVVYSCDSLVRVFVLVVLVHFGRLPAGTFTHNYTGIKCTEVYIHP